jgi:hypothetical protein
VATRQHRRRARKKSVGAPQLRMRAGRSPPQRRRPLPRACRCLRVPPRDRHFGHPRGPGRGVTLLADPAPRGRGDADRQLLVPPWKPLSRTRSVRTRARNCLVADDATVIGVDRGPGRVRRSFAGHRGPTVRIHRPQGGQDRARTGLRSASGRSGDRGELRASDIRAPAACSVWTFPG